MPFALQGERVLLRDWRDSDLEPFARLNANPTARRFFPSTHTREQSDAEVARIRERGTVDGMTFWALELPGVAEFAGFVGIVKTGFEAHFTPCVEIGWRLLPEHWGKGYASEGAKLALSYGFDVLGLNEIVSFTTVSNAPSRKVMERIGMIHDQAGDFDHPRIAEDHPLRRHVLYRIQRPNGRSA